MVDRKETNMKQYELNYYSKFRCIAGECKHTCCAGWEMCIDEHTLTEYKKETCDFRNSLHKGINFKKAKFKADKSGRCAFLNDKGLCEIIINLGEQRLCQVCKDHPRFRSFFSDRVETGLGFSCEQATRDILSFKDKIQPILVADDREESQLSFIENSVLEFRQKALNIVQDRTSSATERLQKLLLLCKADLTEEQFNKAKKAFLSFERLDKNWTKRLKSTKNTPLKLGVEQNLSLIFEQFMANSLYRHLSDAEDIMWAMAIALSCAISWLIIQSIIQFESAYDFEGVVDVIRAYSAEIEYSQKNLDRLFLVAYKLIKI